MPREAPTTLELAVDRAPPPISDTGAIPSRAAAWLMLRDVQIATGREVAFSITESDTAA
jgi:hypothetical protein